MKKTILFLFWILTTSWSGFSNNQIEISLLTCSSGEETFTAWGHSAMRIQDKRSNIDIVYNFGLFDFNTPNFYMKFIKGKLKYKLGVHRTQDFYNSYLLEDRQIIEQELNLSEESEENIISTLQYLYKPENRYYYYSFVKKNCTSELRDLIFENVPIDFTNTTTEKTYRDQIHEFLTDSPWLRFGMSLIMGYKVDRKINKFESMFLPYYLYHGLKDLNKNEEQLVKREQTFNNNADLQESYPFFVRPVFVLFVLFLITIFIRSGKLEATILLVTGITGLVIFTVSLITEHPELRYNLNPLWINPLYIALAFMNNKTSLKRYLAILLQVLLIVMIPVWLFKVQYFEWPYLPILLILSLYNLRIIYPQKKKKLYIKI